MNNTSSSAIKPSIKKLHKIGSLSIIVIDGEIVRHLQLSDESYFIEIVNTDGGIELKPFRKNIHSAA